MANAKQLRKLKEGVLAWNVWRQEHPGSRIDLREADLTGADLREADLTRADLRKAHLHGVDLREADFRGADLTKADLNGADLSWGVLRGTILDGVDLSMADLPYADLTEADLSNANLRGVDLSHANLVQANLREADLREADLREVNFQQASLIEVNLDGATLTGACLWETQRAGWSIQDIICDAAYWDLAMQEETTYSQGEFERLHADKTKIILHYEGGIGPIEIATLPALIQRMEAAHPGCVLRLHSIQDAPGGATVTLVVDEVDNRDPDILRTLKTELETVSQRAIYDQRALLEERGIRGEIETELQILYNKILPRIVGHTTVYGELTMGDKFENIHNATIVNRSLVEKSFNKVKSDFDEDTADTLKKVADEIEKSHNREAAENFDSFNEELQKPEPKRAVLRALWSGVTTALPIITQMTDVTTKITKLLGY